MKVSPIQWVFTVLGVLLSALSILSLVQRLSDVNGTFAIAQDAFSLFNQMINLVSANLVQPLWDMSESVGLPLPDLISAETYTTAVIPSLLIASGYLRALSRLRSEGVIAKHRWGELLQPLVGAFIAFTLVGWALIASLIKDSVRDEVHAHILFSSLQWMGYGAGGMVLFFIFNAVLGT